MLFTIIVSRGSVSQCMLGKMAGVQDLSVTTRPHPMTKISTHSGMFHADEALACFMLKQLPEYKDAEVIRLDMRSFKCYVTLFSGNLTPPRNINNVQLYTFETLFSGKSALRNT